MAVALSVAAFASASAFTATGPASRAPEQAAGPTLSVTSVVSGNFSRIWDLAFSPDGTMFFTERHGRLSVRLRDGTTRPLVADLSDLWASGETGLMAVEVDPAFLSNRRLYTCQGTTDFDNTVQVVTWVIDAGYTTASRVNDPLVGGIDGGSGRHGGCQLRVDHDGYLRVSTGDTARGTNPQDLGSLAGKTLRVDRFAGSAAPGNALVGAAGADPRVFTYGHRNVQGLALRPGTTEVWSVEHGPGIEDEINRLVNGGNYGWDPVPDYNESVPMTDLVKFPGAIPAAWASGPTIATSGAAFLEGAQWGTWQGSLAVSTLNGQSLRIFPVDSAGRLGAPITEPALDHTFGRLRAAELGPDGVLYLTTDNGSNDRVLSVRATGVDFAGVGVATSATGRIDLATRRADDTLATREFTGSWSGYSSAGGLASADPDLASWGAGRIDLVIRGADDALWHRTRAGGTWSAWSTVGGFITSAPTAVASGPNRIDVFARGLDGGLWANAWTGTSWYGWYALGGALTSEPDVASWSPGRLDVVARGADGALWHRAWTGTAWSPWQSLGGGMTSGPGAVSWGPNRLDVFIRGLDGQLWSRGWTVTGWSPWYPLGGSLASAPDAMAPAPGQLEVFARGLDGAIWRRGWTGSVWSPWTPVV